MDNFAVFTEKTYSQYRKNFDNAPEWSELSEEQQEGFKTASVHAAACILETLHGSKTSKRYLIKPTTNQTINKEIQTERERQDKKWGKQDHTPHYWMVILMEEVGEAANAICGKAHDYKNYREELIQIAAVAVAAIESYDRSQLNAQEPIATGRCKHGNLPGFCKECQSDFDK